MIADRLAALPTVRIIGIIWITTLQCVKIKTTDIGELLEKLYIRGEGNSNLKWHVSSIIAAVYGKLLVIVRTSTAFSSTTQTK